MDFESTIITFGYQVSTAGRIGGVVSFWYGRRRQQRYAARETATAGATLYSKRRRTSLKCNRKIQYRALPIPWRAPERDIVKDDVIHYAA